MSFAIIAERVAGMDTCRGRICACQISNLAACEFKEFDYSVPRELWAGKQMSDVGRVETADLLTLIWAGSEYSQKYLSEWILKVGRYARDEAFREESRVIVAELLEGQRQRVEEEIVVSRVVMHTADGREIIREHVTPRRK